MTDENAPAIVWFREDLRLADNAALRAACEDGRKIIPVYILDEETADMRPLGGASRWWLHHSLRELGDALKAKGVDLILRRGQAANHLIDIARKHGVTDIHWNRRYTPGEIEADKATKTALGDAGLSCTSHAGALLAQPWEIETQSGDPYRVFTPFWKSLRERGWREQPHPEPRELSGVPSDIGGDDLDDWNLLPQNPDWATAFPERWQPGEAGARSRLQDFIEDGLSGYASKRDRPDLNHTSQLSPHLRFGEITPVTIAATVRHAMDAGDVPDRDASKFLSEVGWREFSYHLIYHFPFLPDDNLQKRFNTFPWHDNADALKAWQTGQTGYPIVDAGMRELWREGIMHNRIRMVVASFLIKHLLIHWKEGENWFWDTLVDADHANNAASWQWVAGTGADAAPYFRVFNPILQGEKHDPKGDYVRKYVPEIADLPDKYLNKPWEAPEDVLADAGIKLGDTYPHPIVDHIRARNRALAAFDEIKDKPRDS